jgi:hypothetical protein
VGFEHGADAGDDHGQSEQAGDRRPPGLDQSVTQRRPLAGQRREQPALPKQHGHHGDGDDWHRAGAHADGHRGSAQHGERQGQHPGSGAKTAHDSLGR